MNRVALAAMTGITTIRIVMTGMFMAGISVVLTGKLVVIFGIMVVMTGILEMRRFIRPSVVMSPSYMLVPVGIEVS